jgi:hypothetical protein
MAREFMAFVILAFSGGGGIRPCEKTLAGTKSAALSLHRFRELFDPQELPPF